MGSQGPDLDLGLCIQQQAALASPGGQQALPAGGHLYGHLQVLYQDV